MASSQRSAICELGFYADTLAGARVLARQSRDGSSAVICSVAAAARVSPGELMGHSRRQPTARLRQVCMYILRRDMDLSYTQIGRIFNRDHTTVMHGVKRVSEILGGK